jgi:hypothetical protein
MQAGEEVPHPRVPLIDRCRRRLVDGTEQRRPDLARQRLGRHLAVTALVGTHDIGAGSEEFVGGVVLAGMTGAAARGDAAGDQAEGLLRHRLVGPGLGGGRERAASQDRDGGEDGGAPNEYDTPGDKTMHGMLSSDNEPNATRPWESALLADDWSLTSAADLPGFGRHSAAGASGGPSRGRGAGVRRRPTARITGLSMTAVRRPALHQTM